MFVLPKKVVFIKKQPCCYKCRVVFWAAHGNQNLFGFQAVTFLAQGVISQGGLDASFVLWYKRSMPSIRDYSYLSLEVTRQRQRQTFYSDTTRKILQFSPSLIVEELALFVLIWTEFPLCSKLKSFIDLVAVFYLVQSPNFFNIPCCDWTFQRTSQNDVAENEISQSCRRFLTISDPR